MTNTISKSLKTLFRKEPKMHNTQSTAERLEGLKKRYASLSALVRSGAADEETILEEQRLHGQVLAAEQVHNAMTTTAYRARINEGVAERRKRIHAMLDEGGDLVPRLLLWCASFNEVRDDVQQNGMGFEGGNVIDHIVLPLDFGDKLRAVINTAGVEWDFCATGPFSENKKAARPKRIERLLRAPKFYGGPPLGYSGAWDVINDRPMEEPVDGAGTSVAFLTPGA